jgi:hypothetical protein
MHMIIEQTNTTYHCPPIRSDLNLLLLPADAGMAVDRRQNVRDRQEGEREGGCKNNLILICE